MGIIKLEGAKFDDCEDIASFNRGGKNYLLLADAGDNDFNRRTYRLHVIEEPSLQEDTKKKKKKRPQDVDVEMTIPFRYPDGPHDCEGVAVDAAAGKVYLATKEPARGTRVYEIDLPAEPPAEPLTAQLIARLEISRTAAMDISPDGRRAVFSTDSYLYESHAKRTRIGRRRAPGMPLADAPARQRRIDLLWRRRQVAVSHQRRSQRADVGNPGRIAAGLVLLVSLRLCVSLPLTSD